MLRDDPTLRGGEVAQQGDRALRRLAEVERERVPERDHVELGAQRRQQHESGSQATPSAAAAVAPSQRRSPRPAVASAAKARHSASAEIVTGAPDRGERAAGRGLLVGEPARLAGEAREVVDGGVQREAERDRRHHAGGEREGLVRGAEEAEAEHDHHQARRDRAQTRARREEQERQDHVGDAEREHQALELCCDQPVETRWNAIAWPVTRPCSDGQLRQAGLDRARQRTDLARRHCGRAHGEVRALPARVDQRVLLVAAPEKEQLPRQRGVHGQRGQVAGFALRCVVEEADPIDERGGSADLGPRLEPLLELGDLGEVLRCSERAGLTRLDHDPQGRRAVEPAIERVEVEPGRVVRGKRVRHVGRDLQPRAGEQRQPEERDEAPDERAPAVQDRPRASRRRSARSDRAAAGRLRARSPWAGRRRAGARESR